MVPVVKREFDPYNQLASELVTVGGVAQPEILQSWDATGRRTSLTAAGIAYGFGYRPDGRMSSVSAQGMNADFTYTDAGLLSSRLNPWRKETIMQRNHRGMPTKIAGAHPTSGSVFLTQDLQYRADGRWETFEATRVGGAPMVDERGYNYNSRGQLTSESYTPFTASGLKTITYGFDAQKLGVRTLQKVGSGSPNHFTWASAPPNGFGQVLNDYPNGIPKSHESTGTVSGKAKVTLKLDDVPVENVEVNYDGVGDQRTWRAVLPKVGVGLHLQQALAVSPDGTVATTTSNFAQLENKETFTSGYDGAGNLETHSSVKGDDRVFTWDAAGSLLEVSLTPGQAAPVGRDRFTAVYDGFGRRVATKWEPKPGEVKVKQCAKELNKVVLAEAPPEELVLGSSFLGRLVIGKSGRNLVLSGNADRKVDKTPQVVSFIPPQTTTESAYDPLTAFQPLWVTVNGTRTWHVFGPDLSGVFGGFEGSGGLEFLFQKQANGTVVSTGLLNDAAGHATARLSQPGIPKWNTIRYTGYGAYPGVYPKPAEELAAFAQSIGWRGNRIDPTGFYWLGARYYDPEAGRFISTDPLGHDTSLSLYDYCGGDPVNFVDPLGLCPAASPVELLALRTSSTELYTMATNLQRAAQTAPNGFLQEEYRSASLRLASKSTELSNAADILATNRSGWRNKFISIYGYNAPIDTIAYFEARFNDVRPEGYGTARGLQTVQNATAGALKYGIELVGYLSMAPTGRLFSQSEAQAARMSVAHIGGPKDCIAQTAQELRLHLKGNGDELSDLLWHVNGNNIETIGEAVKLIENHTGLWSGQSVTWANATTGRYAVFNVEKTHVIFGAVEGKSKLLWDKQLLQLRPTTFGLVDESLWQNAIAVPFFRPGSPEWIKWVESI